MFELCLAKSSSVVAVIPMRCVGHRRISNWAPTQYRFPHITRRDFLANSRTETCTSDATADGTLKFIAHGNHLCFAMYFYHTFRGKSLKPEFAFQRRRPWSRASKRAVGRNSVAYSANLRRRGAIRYRYCALHDEYCALTARVTFLIPAGGTPLPTEGRLSGRIDQWPR